MGSLPDLSRAPPAPPIAAPARARTLAAAPPRLNQQLPLSKAEWVRAARRRESVASSTGAASVRRLLVKAPPRPPRALLYRFAALCGARALLAAALLPLTALRAATDRRGAAELALMHACAALAAPAAPALARRAPPHLLALAAHAPLALLAGALAGGAAGGALLPLYAAAGLGVAPLALAGGAASTALAGALGGSEEGRRRVALRRALRALRAAHDVGLLAGALALAAALAAWPPASNLAAANATQAPSDNRTTPRWPPSSDFFMDDFDDEEEATCGASGCPSPSEEETPPLSPGGWCALAGCWAAALAAGGALAAVGARGASSPPAELAPGPPPLRDLRTILALPLAAFIGMQEGFIYTSYIKWYAVCVGGWGAGWAALAGSGALQILAAATLSMAAARGRRGALAAGGFAAHACLLLALLRWRAARADVALPGVAAAAWGVCGALWDTLQSGICIGTGGAWGTAWRGPYGYLSAARHAGTALACAARAALCVRAQLATLAAALLAGAAAHAALELRVRRARKPVRTSAG